MTYLEVAFHYQTQPGEKELRALDSVRGRMALADGSVERDADHDVGEDAAPRLPHT